MPSFRFFCYRVHGDMFLKGRCLTCPCSKGFGLVSYTLENQSSSRGTQVER